MISQWRARTAVWRKRAQRKRRRVKRHSRRLPRRVRTQYYRKYRRSERRRAHVIGGGAHVIGGRAHVIGGRALGKPRATARGEFTASRASMAASHPLDAESINSLSPCIKASDLADGSILYQHLATNRNTNHFGH